MIQELLNGKEPNRSINLMSSEYDTAVRGVILIGLAATGPDSFAHGLGDCCWCDDRAHPVRHRHPNQEGANLDDLCGHLARALIQILEGEQR